MVRKKRSRNKGYWFRTGRGWFVTEGRSAKPLCDVEGNHIRNADSKEEAKSAYIAYLTERGKVAERKPGNDLTVSEVCKLYLDSAQSGNAETYDMRSRYLFDLCTGYPARFREKLEEATPKDRIHPGCGDYPIMSLTRLDIERWVKAHSGWKSARSALQAVRRAINYCKESGVITANPVKGLKVPKVGRRVAYIAPEIEETIYQYALPSVALAVKVCIRVGARPDIEFAHLEARHVVETAEGQCWKFPASEAKGRLKERTLYIPEEIAVIVRKAVKRRKGRVFQDEKGNPWSRVSLQGAFRRLKNRLIKKGFTPDNPFCPYVCRHTFAKRMLGGYWGSPVTLEILAGLMGNTPSICWNHYAQWASQYVDPFWAAITTRENPLNAG